MKKIFFVILFSFIVVFGFSQSTVYIRGDTVKIKKEGGNSNLVIENSTRGVTNGVLTNIGNGVTRFIIPSGSPGSFVDSVTLNTGGDSIYVWIGGVHSTIAIGGSGGSLRFGVSGEDVNIAQDRFPNFHNTYKMLMDSVDQFIIYRSSTARLYMNSAATGWAAPSVNFLETDPDSTSTVRKIAYTMNLHGTFTPFSLVDKKYVDSLSVSAGNGLTDSSRRIILGGPLYKNTTIGTSASTLTISTSVGGVNPLSVDATTGVGILSNVTNGTAFSGVATTGIGGLFTSANLPLWGVNTSASAANIGEAISLNRIGPGVVGMGTRILTNLPNTSSSIINASSMITGWTNATPGAETSYFELDLNNAGSGTTPKLIIFGAGNILVPGYGSGTHTGTPAYSLAVDASGNIIEDVPGGGGGGSSDTSVIIIDTTYNPTASVNTLGDTLIEKSIDIQLNGSSITPTSDTRKMLFNIVTGVGSVPTLYSQDDSLTSSRRAFIGDGKELRFVSHSIVNNDSVVVAQDKNQWSANYQGSAGIDGFVVNRGLHEATMYSQSDLTGKQHIVKTDTTGAYIESNSVYMRLVPTSGTVRDSAFGRSSAGLLEYGPVAGFSYTPFTQEYTGSTSTVKTLTHSASAFMIPAAFVTMNGVLFDEANYSISGTTLTLSGVTVLTTDIIKVKYYY